MYLQAWLPGHDVSRCPSKMLKNTCDCSESAGFINKTRRHTQPDFFFSLMTERMRLFFSQV